MIPLEGQLQDITAACEASGVKRLEIFGSCARDDYTPASDVDFIVDFNNPMKAGLLDRFLNLNFSLEEILNRKIDLVERSGIQNPILLKHICNEGKLVYEA